MVMVSDIKDRICSLFNVVEDEGGVRRVVTPLEFSAAGDFVVVRVRPAADGRYLVDENGDAALFAAMAGGDTECDAVQRWVEEVGSVSPIKFEGDVIAAVAKNDAEVAPMIFRVAQAAQQLYALAVYRATRQLSDFKARVAQVLETASAELHFTYDCDHELPIAGGMQADFYIPTVRPLIIIAANSLPRLLEAEIIHMQYQLSKMPGTVIAVAESQAVVGKKHFERANYYTDKTVSFDPIDMRQLISHHLSMAREAQVV